MMMSNDTIWDRKDELALLIEEHKGTPLERYLETAMLSLELWEEEYVKGNIRIVEDNDDEKYN
jgi:hypothetical protein